MLQKGMAAIIIDSLRKGKPPDFGVESYSVGNEKLIQGIKNYHLSSIAEHGIIRFINGSWGSGKTHLFRQLRDTAFKNNCLVSSVELGGNSNTMLNKFQSIFSAIITHIDTPQAFKPGMSPDVTPFGNVLQEALFWIAMNNREVADEVTSEGLNTAIAVLMKNRGIDIDFKKMVQHYWATFLPKVAHTTVAELTRGEILQWFAGEGTISIYKKPFGVAKIISKETAKLMLHSLAEFIKLAGYQGIIVLFDEAEQSYSSMKTAALREAHNNLLSIINNIESVPGLFLIYATTPDFFTDNKHGIVIYGALSSRIGRPEERAPRALDVIWNLDADETKLEDYQEAAKKIRQVYAIAYPAANLPSEEDVCKRVAELNDRHSKVARIKFWRLMVSAIVRYLDDCMEGESRSMDKIYQDVMDKLRED